jgi:hypothetical protein
MLCRRLALFVQLHPEGEEKPSPPLELNGVEERERKGESAQWPGADSRAEVRAGRATGRISVAFCTAQGRIRSGITTRRH